MKNEAYKKVTEHHFKVDDEVIAITYFNNESGVIELEEVRKNGQEDTHMKATMYRNNDGVWEWENGNGNTMFAEYHSEDLEDSIIAYIQENGCPDE